MLLCNMFLEIFSLYFPNQQFKYINQKINLKISVSEVKGFYLKINLVICYEFNLDNVKLFNSRWGKILAIDQSFDVGKHYWSYKIFNFILKFNTSLFKIDHIIFGRDHH